MNITIDVETAETFLKKAIALSKSTPTEVLEYLSNSDIPSIRKAVAKNPNTSKAVLEKLSKDPILDVQLGVASNENTSKSALNHLADSPEVTIRSKVASNKNASPSTLAKLSRNNINFILTLPNGLFTCFFLSVFVGFCRFYQRLYGPTIQSIKGTW